MKIVSIDKMHGTWCEGGRRVWGRDVTRDRRQAFPLWCVSPSRFFRRFFFPVKKRFRLKLSAHAPIIPPPPVSAAVILESLLT